MKNLTALAWPLTLAVPIEIHFNEMAFAVATGLAAVALHVVAFRSKRSAGVSSAKAGRRRS